ncbi:MAG: hypothetical protein JNL08_05795 [Planctomycetes bacterium]|nr:hypothetical protein [Planctomycetota bacterium]
MPALAHVDVHKSTPQSEATEQLLCRLRDGDSSFEARRLLCIVRADRRPFDVQSLRLAIDSVAADEGMTSYQVREHLDSALRLEGSSLEAWQQSLRRSRARLGRGGAPQQQLLQGIAT